LLCLPIEKTIHSIFKCKKKGFPLFSYFLFDMFLLEVLGDWAHVLSIERQTHRATMNVVLVCSFTFTVIHTGRTITDMRCTLLLRELETTVSALVERPSRSDIHFFAQEHLSHVLLLFFRSRARIIRATLATAVRDLASLTYALLVYEVRALKHDKARRAVEANLADQVRMIHGFLDCLTSSF
jgi:hypothetical protein